MPAPAQTSVQVIFLPNGDFRLNPASAYHNASTTGNDLGVDATLLPTITYLAVVPDAKKASLSFKLQSVNGAADSTQPCVLEVSLSRNLHSDLATYTVIPDLNPVFFKQPDTSARSNVLLPPVTLDGDTVTWQIGVNSSVTGDDGDVHDLRLTPSTLYYGRVQCYGDTQQFTFTTTAPGPTGMVTPISPTLHVGTGTHIGR